MQNLTLGVGLLTEAIVVFNKSQVLFSSKILSATVLPVMP
jgi:hypothetical protein